MIRSSGLFRRFSIATEHQVLNEIKNNVFYCKINNPASKNALSRSMIEGIQSSLNRIQTNPDLIAAVFCSNVKNVFCTGANLKVD
jgi:enoyl-CoA hydratase/carnithine racemase